MREGTDGHHWAPGKPFGPNYPERDGRDCSPDDLVWLCRLCHEIVTGIRRLSRTLGQAAREDGGTIREGLALAHLTIRRAVEEASAKVCAGRSLSLLPEPEAPAIPASLPPAPASRRPSVIAEPEAPAIPASLPPAPASRRPSVIAEPEAPAIPASLSLAPASRGRSVITSRAHIAPAHNRASLRAFTEDER